MLVAGWIFGSAWLVEADPLPPHPGIRPDPGRTGRDSQAGIPISLSGKSPLPGSHSIPDELDAIVQKITRNKGNMDEPMKDSL